jgi:transcriptional regulator with XRE-family HTH domain
MNALFWALTQVRAISPEVQLSTVRVTSGTVRCHRLGGRVKVFKKSVRFTADESVDWLYARMNQLGIGSLDELTELTGLDKGTLSRYFRHERRPSIDVVEPLSQALQVSVETLLRALGAIARKNS